MEMRATILDVAKAAGVSRQTVTRAMNDLPGISAETRDRVLAAGERLGYRPSRFARNMARQKSRSVGLTLLSLRNPYYSDLAADVIAAAAARKVQVGISASDRDSVLALAEQVDGLVGYFDLPDDEIRRLARRIPLVLIERRVEGVHSVELDFASGLRGFVDALIARGSRRFAFVDSLLGHSPSDYRPTARREWLEQIVPGLRVIPAHESIGEAAAALAQLHRAEPHIDTVIAFSDIMAMGLLQGAHALGLRVPDDVRIAGIDGLALGEVMHPPLSTLSIDRPAIASRSLRLLEESWMLSRDQRTREILVPAPLLRASA